MPLSQTSEYALRAVLFLADRGRGGPVPVAEVAAGLAVPRNYLSKILSGLAAAGVLTSLRGPRGGFRLAGSPRQLTLARVVGVFEDGAGRGGLERRCLLGRAKCDEASPCGAHGRWSALAEEAGAFFRETTVADVLGGPVAQRGGGDDGSA